MKKKSRVAVVGRVNVGKSTLFNRLTQGPRAIVSAQEGTTRDRKEGDCYWLGKIFSLIDTGGLEHSEPDRIETAVSKQALTAIEKSDLILFVVDAKTGITPSDQVVAQRLRKINKPILLVANKVDSARDRNLISEFYTLGFGDPWPISSVSGTGTGDLLDAIAQRVSLKQIPDESSIHVALIGKPNVGKSSILNALVGEERSIVSPEPYTTRDANTIPMLFEGQQITLIDTAGVRRKKQISKQSIEAESVSQSLASIKKADVVLFITESHKPLTAQDRQLASLIDESKAAVIIIGNKWDLVGDKDAKKSSAYTDYYHRALNFLWWAPVILMSATEQTKLTKVKQAIVTVYKEKFRKIEDNALGKFLKVIIKKHPPTKGKGTRHPYIYRIKQKEVNPPAFAVQIADNTSLNYTYLNFIEKELRGKFGFEGAPIKMWVEKHKKDKNDETDNRPR